MPRVDDIIDKQGEAQYLTKGYYQVPVAPEDRDKMTFACDPKVQICDNALWTEGSPNYLPISDGPDSRGIW
jgi:hypothetical protein